MAKRRFAGPVAFEGVGTGDEREFTAGALRWDLPITVKPSHDSNDAVGVISEMERRDDGSIWASGTFLDTPMGRNAAAECEALQAEGMSRSVSVDLDTVSMELRVRGEVLKSMDDEMELEASDVELDENGRAIVMSREFGDFATVFTGATIANVSFAVSPAFRKAGAHFTLLDDEDSVGDEVEDVNDEADPEADDDAFNAALIDLVASNSSLVASAYPVAPPASWFENPGFDGPTPLTIDDDGRIYGHAALWDQFHLTFAKQRVVAPRSKTNYSYFRVGYLRTAEGTDVPIGKITMSTGHAAGDLSPLDSMSHYDDTGACVADIACGEDEHGIWFSGALRPGVTDEQVRELRAAPLSGDWREIKGNLELVALLAVNVPGFNVPRMAALVASGEVRSLTASAVFETSDEVQKSYEIDPAVAEARRLGAAFGAAAAETLQERNRAAMAAVAAASISAEESTENGSVEPELEAAVVEMGHALTEEAERLERIEKAKRLNRILLAKHAVRNNPKRG